MFTSVFCGGKGKGKMGKREDFELENLPKMGCLSLLLHVFIKRQPCIFLNFPAEKAKTTEQPAFESHGLPCPFVQVETICMAKNQPILEFKFSMNMVNDLASCS